MRRFFLFILILLGLNFLWIHRTELNQFGIASYAEDLKVKVASIIETYDGDDWLNQLYTTVAGGVGIVEDKIKQFTYEQSPIDQPKLETPKLETPTNQIFSVYNIELGSSKGEVEQQLGSPKRSATNEYGTEWYTYHENYHNFVKVMYDDNDKVIGLYTNQDLISSANGISLDSSKQSVRDTLGEPLTRLQKGFVFYQLEEDRDYDMYDLDDTFVTVFYDQHENDTVTAIQIIKEELEQSKSSLYTEASESLKEGFELQMFDLVNATRVNHGLQVLTWDEHVMQTARKHSSDMAANNYFDHTNLNGQSPFDRMEADGIAYTLAGENLAYGQFSSIFAHEGLMNSLGHRKNILKSDFEYLGVGVAFNDESQPYYTQNYYAN